MHPADANSDGVVDAADLTFWKQAWNEYFHGTGGGEDSPPKEIWKGVADANENGTVDNAADPNNQNLPSATNTDWVAFQALHTAGLIAEPLDQQLGNLPLYAGYWWDDAIGLYHVRHRVYRPEWGRWLQRDPLGYAPGWNLYQYVNGMPWSAVDPMGLYGLKDWVFDSLRLFTQPTAEQVDVATEVLSSVGKNVAYTIGGAILIATLPVNAVTVTIGIGFAALGGYATGQSAWEAVTGEALDAWGNPTGEQLTAAERAGRATDAAFGLGGIGLGIKFRSSGPTVREAFQPPQFLKNLLKSNPSPKSNTRTPATENSPVIRESPNVFPKNPNDFLPGAARSVKPNGNQVVYPNELTRIRIEQHPLHSGETFSPRHHGLHYHVEIRPSPTIGWSNPSVIKLLPPGYAPGHGTGFVPGEAFPGMINGCNP